MKFSDTRRRVIATACHLYPLYSGCGTIANSRLVRLLEGNSSGLHWGRLHNGMAILVSLDDFNGRAAYFGGDTDRKLTWICSRIVRPGDTVVDVGANVGLVTLTLAKLVGATGRVVAFEPNPELGTRLRQSLIKNLIEHVELHECALGDTPGELSLVIPAGHSGRGSLIRGSRGNSSLEVTVPVREMDAVLSNDLGLIRLLKLDVEGFEYQVLQGARQLFESRPPDAVFFEINNCRKACSEEPTVQFLGDRGYEFFAIHKSWLFPRISRFDPEVDHLPGHDLLACKSGAVSDDICDLLNVSRL